MDNYSSLLLEIYRAARQMAADEFPNAVMAMLRATLQFDAARLLCAGMAGGTAVVRGSIMYNIPSDNSLDWESIQHQDLVVPHVLNHLGEPFAFHAPTLFAGPAHAIMRDYVQRYEHRNGLVIVVPDADSGLLDALSVYRAGADAQFGERERHLIRYLMPHLQESLKLNRMLAVPSAAIPARGALLIAQLDGAVQTCAAPAAQLIATEWPDWRPARLPPALLAALSRTGCTRYEGTQLCVTCQRLNTLLFLRVAARSPLLRLSPRELQVARLYGQGRAAKAVANALGITPATTRNMLQRIYQKLDVHDKAALAQLMLAHL